MIISVKEQDLQNMTIEADRFSGIFLWTAILFVFIDFTWILCVWSAASVGTPTQSMGRDGYLRWVRFLR